MIEVKSIRPSLLVGSLRTWHGSLPKMMGAIYLFLLRSSAPSYRPTVNKKITFARFRRTARSRAARETSVSHYSRSPSSALTLRSILHKSAVESEYQSCESGPASADLAAHTGTVAHALDTNAGSAVVVMATLPAARSGSSSREQHSAG